MDNSTILFTDRKFDDHRAFWEDKLHLCSQVPFFQGDIRSNRTYVKVKDRFVISDSAFTTVNNYAGKKRVERFILLFAALKILLARYCNSTKLAINTPLLNLGPNQSKEGILPIFFEIKMSESVKDYILSLSQNILEYYKYQDFPYKKLEQYNNRSNFSNVLFSYQDLHYPPDMESIKEHDLIFMISDRDSIVLEIQYDTGCFSRDFMKRFLNNYNIVLESFIDHSSIVGDLDVLSRDEKELLLSKFNNTAFNYPKEETLVSLLNDVVRKNRNQTAIIFNGYQYTYSYLDSKSNLIANYLASRISKGDVVAVMMEKSFEGIASVIGVLKAGGCYLPLDPNTPEDRLRYMIDDSELKYVITSEKYKHLFYHERVCCITNTDWNIEGIIHPISSLLAQDVAYLIYTSGSSGRPKGVKIDHKGIVNTVLYHIVEFEMTPEDCYLQFLALTFDGSILDIFNALLSGSKLLLPRNEDLITPKTFLSFIELHCVTVTTLTPYFIKSLNKRAIKGLRILVSAGERANVDDALHYALSLRFYNGYGPTEASVNTTLYKVDGQKHYQSIPIGLPSGNKKVFIVNDKMQLLPVGVEGEICISGIGITKGYINLDTLNNEKFISSPFNRGETLYKTGDIGRWLENGNLEFIGRKDEQVKIRGYRVELGEIESVFKTIEYVRDAAVVVFDDLNDHSLAAFYIASIQMNTEDIVNYLKKFLPHYMIPVHIFQMDCFPLTSSGKVNRKELSTLINSLDTKPAKASTQIEEKVLKVWEFVLERKDISINDNFFSLGGDSLKAISVASKINEILDIELDIIDIFDHPTIALLAQKVQGSVNPLRQIKPIEEQDHYMASNIQQRMWVLEQLSKKKSAYSIPNVKRIEGPFLLNAFQYALDTLIKKHEILRTSLTIVDGEVRQKIHQNMSTCKVDLVDLENTPNKENIIDQLIRDKLFEVFNMSKAPFLKVTLIKIHNTSYILIVNVHHSIIDERSDKILLDLLVEQYNDYFSKRISRSSDILQYKDFVVWKSKRLDKKKLNSLKAYWYKKLIGLKPLHLPQDYINSAFQIINGKSISFKLNKSTSHALYNLCKEKKCSLFMVFVTLLNVLIYRYTMSKEIIIGTTITERDHPDLENLLGCCLNTLLCYTKLGDSYTWNDILTISRTTVQEMIKHKEYPYGNLLKDLKVSKTGEDQLIHFYLDVHDNRKTVEKKGVNMKDVLVQPYHFESSVGQFDFSFEVDLGDDIIDVAIIYNSDIYSELRAKRMECYLGNLITSLLNDATQPISNVSMYSKIEEELLDLAVHTLTNNEFILTPDTDLSKINTDSNQLMEFTQMLNSRYHVLLSTDDLLMSFNTLDKLLAYIEHKEPTSIDVPSMSKTKYLRQLKRIK